MQLLEAAHYITRLHMCFETCGFKAVSMSAIDGGGRDQARVGTTVPVVIREKECSAKRKILFCHGFASFWNRF